MPKITRYGHERRSNLKAAPAMLSPDVVGRLIGFVDGAASPAPEDEVEQIRAELESSGVTMLADVPASIRGNLEFAVTEEGKAEISRITKIEGKQGTVIIDEYFDIELSEEIPQGASGTARKASGAVASATASRRSARAPQHCADPVVEHKPAGAEPQVVAVEASRQCGKTVSRDWFVRRNDIFEQAIRFLKARAILVDVVNREAQVRTYRVSGKRNAMYLEDVVELAEGLGFEGCA